jgi:hypothetical protein
LGKVKMGEVEVPVGPTKGKVVKVAAGGVGKECVSVDGGGGVKYTEVKGRGWRYNATQEVVAWAKSGNNMDS